MRKCQRTHHAANNSHCLHLDSVVLIVESDKDRAQKIDLFVGLRLLSSLLLLLLLLAVVLYYYYYYH